MTTPASAPVSDRQPRLSIPEKTPATDKIPLLSVIIVSYNTCDMTLDCLRALFADLGDLDAEVWVVDNASRDGSAEAVRRHFPTVRLIENADNIGFGTANNLAMSRSRAKYFLLLNSDAFPRPGAIRALLEYAASHPDAAVIGPRLLNADGSLQISCWKFPSPERAWLENLGLAKTLPRHPRFGDYFRWAHDSERRVDFVIGACMLVRREVYEQIGGFDEAFFLYNEEADWQRRMHHAGWQVAFTPTAEVTHLSGASGATGKEQINRHQFTSLDFYTRKHHGLAGLVSLRLAMLLGSFARALGWSLIYLLFPNQRRTAAVRAGLDAQLFVRQATHWRVQRK